MMIHNGMATFKKKKIGWARLSVNGWWAFLLSCAVLASRLMLIANEDNIGGNGDGGDVTV